MSQLYALVMAGGRGTRFWPESTSKKPKQYLSLTGGEPLLTETLKRFDGLVDANNRFIVTVKEQEALASSCSTGKINKKGLIFEPAARNTAPCILLSVARLIKGGANENDIVAIVPSDHVILNHNGFRETVGKAAKQAQESGDIVTIGITPHFPHTGYGYIHRGESKSNDCFKVSEFKEKPDSDTAKKYIATGEYFWNAGMFVASLKTLIEEFEVHAPEMFKYFKELQENGDDFAKLTETYNRLPSDSVDYAIMEKSNRVSVVPAKFDWNDLGSWDALEAVVEKSNSNTVASAKGTFFDQAIGNIVFAPDKFVALVNVRDLIVVSNDSAVVILPKSDSQSVKKIVDSLKDGEHKDLI